MIGNEDCGQMSAWYVLSSMGIYAVTPGKPIWSIVKPNFEKIKVNFEKNYYSEIYNGKDLRFLGIEIQHRKSLPLANEIIPVPVIQAESKAFKDKLKIEIKSQNSKDEIYYTTNDANSNLDDKEFINYTKPFTIDLTTNVLAYTVKNEQTSNTISATFFKKTK